MRPQIIPVQPFDMIVFGGTGDLAIRKLMPSLYYRDCDNQLPDKGRIFGIARGELDTEQYRERVRRGILEHVTQKDLKETELERFLQRVNFVHLDAKSEGGGWEHLAEQLRGNENAARVFYLSTSPELFGPICRQIQRLCLNCESARVVLEKPIGHSLETAKAINDEVGEVFRENQVYRIDHYLGKETVQNLMALRFANMMFEPLWTRQWIDHVQITVAESIGIEKRGHYYDGSGALRDMVQNHLLQLLCLVAMEPPTTFGADEVRDEKLKILRSLRPFNSEETRHKTVRGQYRAGAIGGKPVSGYLEEEGVAPDSATETFVVLKAEVDNWRWVGVPFYMRTGKRMPARFSEIVIQFKPVPHLIFPKNANQVVANRLVIRLQPDEGIQMYLMTKVPGPGGLRLKQVPLNLSFAETFKMRYPDGYERLLTDVIRGNQTLFMRRDEVEAAWMWVEPILEAWRQSGERPKSYTAGSWGPSAAIALIERDGQSWFDDGF